VTDSNKLGLLQSANMIITRLLKVRQGEQVLLVADSKTDMSMVTALAAEASGVGAGYLVVTIPSREKIGVESQTSLPESVRKILEDFQVVVGLTATSGAPSYDSKVAHLLHTKKIRYMSMVLRSIENWTGGAARANYEEVYSTAQKLAKVFKGREVEVTTPSGTNLSAIIEGRKAIVEAGIAFEPGQSAAFSDGEVSLSTVEGTAKGVAIIDGPIAYLGAPREPVRVEIEKGRVVNVSGGRESRTLGDWLEKVENLDNFAEIGVGVNPSARRNGDWQEEKKGLGTAHFALGDNIYYYGRVHCPIHLDMVTYDPTVAVNGNVIARDRRLHIPHA